MTYTNVHGRRAGRGIRPWLLVPKSLAVGIFLGTLITTSSIWFTAKTPTGTAQPVPQLVIEQVSFIFRFLTVPALITAMAFGIMLFLQHPAVFSRLRWWQTKIITLAIGVPAAHFFMSSRLAALRHAATTSTPNPTAEHQLTLGLLVIIAVTVWLIVLGRLKPRLGQNWAATHQKISPPPPK